MKIKICKDECILCGNCYSVCPEIFDCDYEGVPYCKISTAIKYKKFEKKILKSYSSCPVNAVSYTHLTLPTKRIV